MCTYSSRKISMHPCFGTDLSFVFRTSEKQPPVVERAVRHIYPVVTQRGKLQKHRIISSVNKKKFISYTSIVS